MRIGFTTVSTDFQSDGQRPIVIAIAGSNGAGKSTFYESFLADAGLRFINADVLSNAYQSPSELSEGELPTDQNAARGERPIRSKLLGVIAFVTGAAFAVWTISMSDGISPFVLVVALWVACPYLVIAIAARWVSSVVPTMILACTLVLTASFGVWAFDKIDEDAQGGLILIFIPAYQFVTALILTIMAVLIDRWTGRVPP